MKLVILIAIVYIAHETTAMQPAVCQVDPQLQYTLGDPRNCLLQYRDHFSMDLKRMEVLPGLGFDNLRNLEMGEVFYYNYSLCKTTNDGKYLIPDNTFAIPVKYSHLKLFANYYDHWSNYDSLTSSSLNIGAKGGFDGFSASASFSQEHQTIKTHQVNEQSKTTRVHLREKVYVIKILPGSQLHPTFKSKVFEIAAHVQNNNTRHANYLAELLVRDYGTHYISSTDAGAIIAKIDHISNDYVNQHSFDKKTITQTAGASFLNIVSFHESFSKVTEHNDTTGYNSNLTHTEVVTYGGPTFTPDFSVKEWQAGVPNALVTIDRAGDQLHFAITRSTIPDLPELTVEETSQIVYNAINRYYRTNSYLGCTDPSAPNFSFQANIDDHSCKAPCTNFTFGGIYQTAVNHSQVNPLTGGPNCPLGYTDVLLHKGKILHTYKTPIPNRVCKHFGKIKYHCHTETTISSVTVPDYYSAYWCAALGEVQQNSGYLFGGYYTTHSSNPVTGKQSCPIAFIPLKFGEDIHVCVSDDYEQGSEYSVDFGGFESCSMGNPLAATPKHITDQTEWPHGCPRRYAQHLITVDHEDGCEINSCIKAGAFDNSFLSSVPKLPPFSKPPTTDTNASEAMVIFGLNGYIWTRNMDGTWDNIHYGSEDGMALLNDSKSVNSTESDGLTPVQRTGNILSNGVVATISVFATVAVGTIVAALFMVGRRAVKRSKINNQSGYLTIPNDGMNTKYEKDAQSNV